jgi:alkaline phosphatase D
VVRLRPLLLALVLLGGGAGSAVAQPTSASLFTHGVACGDPTQSGVVLWTRTAAPTTLVPELLDAAGGVARALPAVQTSADSDFTVKAVVPDVPPDSAVAYRFRGPAGELSPTGHCRTAPDPLVAAQLTFGFSGDADWKWRPYPLVNALNREPLAFFVFLGDTIYETTNAEGTEDVHDLAGYREKYRQNREPPDRAPAAGAPLRDMYATFGLYSVPDNHEFGFVRGDPNQPLYYDGGAPTYNGATPFVNQTPGFRERAQAYSEYQPLLDRTVVGTGDPRLDGTRRYYFSQPWGTSARLFVVDDRSYRDGRLRTSDDPEADDPGRTMLGRPQLAWLESELQLAQAEGVTWKLVVISSPIQQIGRASEIGDDADGTKSWAGGFRAERDRLLGVIDEQGIDNVVFLTTDNHYTLINNLRYRDASGALVPARNAFEIITGPLGADNGYPIAYEEDPGLDHGANERAFSAQLAARQCRAGLDPVGLEPDFPGLVAESVWSDGGAQGVVEPAAFGSFKTFSYAVLSIDHDLLSVRVQGMDATSAADLDPPAGLQAYLDEQPHTLLSFQVRGR